MLRHIQLLRNVGSFDSVTPGATVPFDAFSLVYAENGRGKTTLAAVLRSLATANADLLSQRQRLGSVHPPHIILAADPAPVSFQAGVWSATLPDIAVFDDAFVAENVCSGISIETGHRQNLHELILGAQGVTLNEAVQKRVAAVEEHIRSLRAKEEAIPAAAKGSHTTDRFCALKADLTVEEKIREAELALAAARESERISAQPDFQSLALPAFDVDQLALILAKDLPSLDLAAATEVLSHFATLGDGGERWVAEGIGLTKREGAELVDLDCPFCAQPLATSAIIEHYRAYFSAEYAALKDELSAAVRDLAARHGGEVPAAFERDVRVAGERREFWSRFSDMPPFAVDTVALALAWKAARDAVRSLLVRKQAAPLERLAVDDSTRAKIATYHEVRSAVEGVSSSLLATNHAIALVKEKAQSANVTTLAADLTALKVLKGRFSVEIAPLCDAYLAEKAAKTVTEAARNQAREALNTYRQTIFPLYQTAINDYLSRFGAGFRLADVGSINTRAGSSATYNVVINDKPVALSSDTGPSFRNTLSSGDRNALALAFFFASLEQDQGLARKIVVIDDPMTSLDEHRTLVTIEEIVKMARRVSQTIVLSHAKPFLLSLWKSGPKNNRSAMRVVRAQNGSSIELWNVSEDAVTPHDRRYARVLAYVGAADPATERTVATDLRPMLEAWGRVAYPVEFPAEELLGGFINRCENVVGTSREVMKQSDIDALKGLTIYANLFHHDTNPTYQTEHINDQQLAQFAARTLAFIGK